MIHIETHCNIKYYIKDTAFNNLSYFKTVPIKTLKNELIESHKNEAFIYHRRKYSFTCRVINLWNSLSNEIVCCNTVNQFVHKLRAYDLSNFIRGQPFA